jgi:hypothetical protein
MRYIDTQTTTYSSFFFIAVTWCDWLQGVQASRVCTGMTDAA